MGGFSDHAMSQHQIRLLVAITCKPKLVQRFGFGGNYRHEEQDSLPRKPKQTPRHPVDLKGFSYSSFNHQTGNYNQSVKASSPEIKGRDVWFPRISCFSLVISRISRISFVPRKHQGGGDHPLTPSLRSPLESFPEATAINASLRLENCDVMVRRITNQRYGNLRHRRQGKCTATQKNFSYVFVSVEKKPCHNKTSPQCNSRGEKYLYADRGLNTAVALE